MPQKSTVFINIMAQSLGKAEEVVTIILKNDKKVLKIQKKSKNLQRIQVKT